MGKPVVGSDEEEENGGGVQSVDTALRVLSALVEMGPPLMLKTVAERADMPPPKAHRYLVSFCRGGLAERDPASGGYRLGPLAVRLGRERTRDLYTGMLVASYALLPLALLLGDGPALGLLGLLSAPLAIKPLRAVRERTDGPALNGALAGTGALLAVFALLTSIGLVV